MRHVPTLIAIFTLAATTALSAPPTLESLDDLMICQKLFGDSYSTLSQPDKDEKATALTCLLDGKMEGPFTSFWGNGKKRAQGQMKNDALDGHWIRWYEDGKKESEGEWRDGVPHGFWMRFDKKGRKRQEGFFEHGEPICGWKRWDEQGNEQPFGEGEMGCGIKTIGQAIAKKTIEFALRPAFSQLSVTDRISGLGLKTIFKTDLGSGVDLLYSHPFSPNWSLFAWLRSEKTTYQVEQTNGQVFIHEDNSTGGLILGARYYFRPTLLFFGGLGGHDEPHLLAKPNGSLEMTKLNVGRLLLGGQFYGWNIKVLQFWLRAEYERLLKNERDGIQIEGGNALTTTFWIKYPLRPHFLLRMGPTYLTKTLSTSQANYSRQAIGFDASLEWLL